MLASPPLFKNSREFTIVSLVIVALIALRLFFSYKEYQNLQSIDGYYYSDAQVEKVYDSRYYENGATLLKLKSEDGKLFYLFTQKEPPKRFSWVRVKYRLKKETSFLKYMAGFFAKGETVQQI